MHASYSLQRTRIFPPTSQRSPIPSEVSNAPRALVNPQVLRFFIPPFLPVPLVAMAALGPWGQNFGPLNLTSPLHPLPRGSRKNILKFFGDGKQHLDEHIVAFHIACRIIGVEYEDIAISLFVETLQGVVADRFYHLAP